MPPRADMSTRRSGPLLLFPDMAADLGTTVKDLSATLASFFVAWAVGQLFVGSLSDRLGRKGLVLGGLAVLVWGATSR